MTRHVAAGVGVAAILVVGRALGQSPPQLPPPPPPSSPPQYTPPTPPPSSPTQPRTPPRPRPSDRDRDGRDRDTPREPAPPPRPRYAPPPPPEHVERAPREEAVPYARTGFQLGLRLGIAAPLGSVSSAPGDSLSNLTKTQIPLLVEVGVKLAPAIFLGAYVGLGFGGAGSPFHDAQGCNGGSRSCLASSFRIGLEVQYHFQPSERMNPWIGYGIGYESTGASASGGGPEVSVSKSGLELARLSGGLDFRLSHAFGIGPALDFSLGQFTHTHVQGEGTAIDGSIQSTALHEWVTFGVRGVFFP